MMTDALRVLVAGPLTLVQDPGRFGAQRFGVSPSGAMDLEALVTANVLVGNEADEAALEFTLIGGTFEVLAERARIAIAGVEAPITVSGRPFASYRSMTLRRGDRVTIGVARWGLRGYMAVAGGFAVVPVLGSRSTQIRAGFGGLDGRALRSGDELVLRSPKAFNGADRALGRNHWPTRQGPVRVVLGPQADHFTEAGKAALLEGTFEITSDADRMGYRLRGPEIAHRDKYDIISDATTTGSVQVPGSRQPIILLADRQTTGGFPKIATVISADLGRVAQLGSGQTLRFRAVDVGEAQQARRAMLERLRGLPSRLTPTALDPKELSSEWLLAHNLVDGVVGS